MELTEGTAEGRYLPFGSLGLSPAAELIHPVVAAATPSPVFSSQSKFLGTFQAFGDRQRQADWGC